MPSPRISKDNNSGFYFLMLTVFHWYYLFDRYDRWDILADSLKFCKKEKGLKLFGFVFMLNHIHLLFYASDAAGFVRDFKKFTSKTIKENLSKTEPSVLKLFIDEQGTYTFWEPTNMPILIETKKVYIQKMNYIHYNPVKKKYVLQPEHWYWSSANLACELSVDTLAW